MIIIKRDNLIKSDSEALVNSVNTVGIMGRGIALQFKRAFPDNYAVYRKACDQGEVQIGNVFIFPTGSFVNPKYIINFPMKKHWRNKSKLEYLTSGLKALIVDVKRLGIKSISIPPLGCGNGGLVWQEVKSLIEKAFTSLPDVKVQLYEPSSKPNPKTMPVRTKAPPMTIGRALLIQVMNAYTDLAYKLTLLEVQKLAYFLQASGERLRLEYEKGSYGPYAANLIKVLERIEGHFTRGLGDDLRPSNEIELMPNAVEEAKTYLRDNEKSKSRLHSVISLIEGYETPYGMELLSSVHWVAVSAAQPARTMDAAITIIHDWNPRKKYRFRSDHIKTAWKHLKDQHWIN